MGKYRITIEGVGVHHNYRDEVFDADREAKKLAEALKENGHSVMVAKFEVGSLVEGEFVPQTREELLAPASTDESEDEDDGN
jgi:hypothetical protein